jgi:hypothetical protein
MGHGGDMNLKRPNLLAVDFGRSTTGHSVAASMAQVEPDRLSRSSAIREILSLFQSSRFDFEG